VNIETKFNVGDKVWGVTSDWGEKDIPCSDCHGKGGACIPDTNIFVRCETCSGSGETSKEVHRYYAVEERISDIVIRVDGNGTKMDYGYKKYIHHSTFISISEDEEGAWFEAARLSADDQAGELMPRRQATGG
jgi:hypothetical protein